jgi:hypothetical protein
MLCDLAQCDRAGHQRLIAQRRRSGCLRTAELINITSITTIVRSCPPKRRAKPAQAATIKVARIVPHTPRGRAWTLPESDPEAEARAFAFPARMRITRPENDPEA